MKKITCIIIILLFVTCLAGLANKNPSGSVSETEFSRGVWLSFSEINSMLSSSEGFKEEFAAVVKNLKSLNITDLYFHVRSHCDSVVKSEFFPLTDTAKTADFDILEYVLNACHKENIKVYAWINPYRVNATDSDTKKLPENSPVTRWLSDGNSENDKNVVITEGIFLNPAEADVRGLIVDGIKEIIETYQVDGIHFDDYFYPTASTEFDKQSYENYKESTLFPLKLDDWRRANVDALISDCKTAIEQSGKNLVFSISPTADIDKNYATHYADIKSWCQKGLIDEVIPQLYFGYNHTDKDFNFDTLLERWIKLCKNSKSRLKIGLATYKINTASPTDGTEWQDYNDIITRQTIECNQNDAVSGVCYFSYSSLFSESKANTTERNNLSNLDKK